MRNVSDELSLDVRLRRPYQRHERTPRRPRGRTGLRRRRQPSLRQRVRAAGVALGQSSRRQRSTVKVAYVTNRHAGAWRAHGGYLAREGAQREHEPGLGFDARRDDIDVATTLGEWQDAGDVRLWKAIVSPEQATRLDLRAHTRALVTQMERDLGTALQWVAIEHYDTDNPHVHLMVRGRDDGGQPLTIDAGYVQRGIRERSEELATGVLGLRTYRDILASREQAVDRAQFTELDRRILAVAGAHGRVTYAGPPPRGQLDRAQRTVEMRRLDFLVTLGLAQRTAAGTWQISQDLERTLRQAQLAGDILKSRARHQAHVSDPRMPLVVSRIDGGTRLSGRIVGIGLADELRDQRYLLLEGTDRRLHYIVQTPATHAALRDAHVRVGDRIILTGRRAERGGSRIVESHVRVQPAKTGPTGRPTERPRPSPEGGRLPSLKEVERTIGRAVPVMPATDGLIYRGRLVGYARGHDSQRHALVDTGREVVAFRTDSVELPAGRGVRAQAHEVEDDRRRRLIWRLGDDEHERHRERGW